MPDSFGWETIDLASAPALLPREVHIYATLLAADEHWLSEAERILDIDEKNRAALFRFDEDRFRFQKTRTALRILLAGYLDSTPTAIGFYEGPHGKPYLIDQHSDIQFNVSHTKGAAVIAIVRNIAVGIDIEHSRRKVDVEGVGRKVFTATEQASLKKYGNASALQQFFRLWTAKEAYLKATGSGLTCNPATIEANFEKGCYTTAEDPDSLLPYSLAEIETNNQFQVSLAHQSCEAPEIRKLEFR